MPAGVVPDRSTFSDFQEIPKNRLRTCGSALQRQGDHVQTGSSEHGIIHIKIERVLYRGGVIRFIHGGLTLHHKAADEVSSLDELDH